MTAEIITEFRTVVVCERAAYATARENPTIVRVTKASGIQLTPALLPVFLISFNRGQYLDQVIRSYLEQDIGTEIIIHDNGSNDPDTIAVLSRLSDAGIKIYYNDPIMFCDDLNNVNDSIQLYLSDTGYTGPYAVSDCDVDLATARPDALRIYLELLGASDVECVGPMLKIDDIPRSYALFNRVMERHIDQFYGREPDWVETSIGTVAVLRHAIDTTLAVHRAGSTFRRLKNGLRVYHPFDARHLDWYISSASQSAYHATSSADISHWDNAFALSEHGSLPEQNITYKTVEGAIGDLRVMTKSTLSNPP